MQQFFKSEVGRSMVEMLGVLAIIGVLSIGAIAGYSYAVTKWKANETIADLHVRAIEYTRQLALIKKVEPHFSFKNFDLGDKNIFGNPVAGFPLYDDPDFFEIEVRGVSAEVCRQIVRDVEAPILGVAVNDGAYGATEETCNIQTINNLVTMTFLFSKTLEEAGDPLEAPAVVTQARPEDCPRERWANIAGVCCAEDEIGTGGHCCPGSSTGWGQNVGRCCNTSEVYSNGHCCPMGEFWDSVTKRCVGDDGGQCASNDDCLPSEFCVLNTISCGRDKPTIGSCKPMSVSHTKTINSVTYKRSADGMDFWSAQNFCARLGGELVSVSDFDCGYDFVGNDKWAAYCNTGSDISAEGTRSDVMKKFMSGFGAVAIWTNYIHTTALCYSTYINLRVGFVHRGYRTDAYRALCRMP